ncbi:uncharacterized protein LY89DRAFT_690997 [Mollisia scopiformis]|uniref:F-box domain-containing protein n=1 Tax=Mollisia scopiformis TaxID=149040 RepID=A0A132B836_MOLSC|nr:uncharacterized protein LY89DRAFT_690997 [Mollisia scopiformis]KUJ08562.1 hypothetical protein LY89DRAFT_690997 [Mollisia scopiformis]
MGKLTDILQSLKKEDGSSNESKRESELTSLVPYLSLSEVRALRLRLNAIVIPNDLCTRFPLEIVESIAQYLDLEEIIQARHISKSWWHVFGCRESSVQFLKWHFPLVWEQDFKHLTKDEQVSDRMSPHKLLLTEAEKRIRIKQGQYHSMEVYQLAHSLKEVQYCNGRMAFRAVNNSHGDNESINVWDLRSEVSVLYTDENREDIYRWQLSDSLIVCEKRGPPTLLVWRLDRDISDSPTAVRLPSNYRSLSVRHKQIALITHQSEVMVWTWGGALKLVDTSEFSQKLGKGVTRFLREQVLFHPLHSNHIFVVSQAYIEDGRELLVSEYTITSSQWKLAATHHLTDLSAFLDSETVIQLHDGNIGIHGFDGRAQSDWMRSSDKIIFPTERPYLLTTFDISTKRFSHQTYWLQGWASEQLDISINREQILLWRDRLCMPVYNTHMNARHRPEGVTDMILAGFAPIEQKPSKIERWYGRTKEDNQALLVPRDAAMGKSALAYCWIGGNEFAKEARERGSFLTERMVLGDDEFVVLVGCYGFVVWSFDEKVILRKSGSSSDPNLPPGLLHPLHERW